MRELLKPPSGNMVYDSSRHSISHRERPPDVVKSAVVSGQLQQVHSYTLAGLFGLLVYQKCAWENEKNRIHFGD
jgi:hypothetical protein